MLKVQSDVLVVDVNCKVLSQRFSKIFPLLFSFMSPSLCRQTVCQFEVTVVVENVDVDGQM